MDFIKLEDLLSTDDIKYEQTLGKRYINNGTTENIILVSTKDEINGNIKYGLNSVIIANNKNLPKIAIENIIPLEYARISRFENFENINSTHLNFCPFKFTTLDGYVEIKLLDFNGLKNSYFIDAITKKDRIKELRCFGHPNFYFVGKTDQNKYNLFDIDVGEDKFGYLGSKIKNIIKCCDDYKRNWYTNDFYLLKQCKDKIKILKYICSYPYQLNHETYNGKIISSSKRFFIVKNENKFSIFDQRNFELLKTYTNDNIINIELYPYTEEDWPDYHEVVILTTKDNMKKVLSITVKDDKLEILENPETFNQLTHNYSFILIDDDDNPGIEDGFSLIGRKDNTYIEIGVKPNGSIKILKTIKHNNSNDIGGPVLRKTMKGK